MKRALSLAFICVFGFAMLLVAQHARRDSGPLTNAQIKARVHAFLERSLGWQKLDKLEVTSISGPDASGLRTVIVLLAKGDQHKEAKYLITPDGKEIIEGQADLLSGDPWASNRAKLDLRGAPASGSVNAPVTIVEFSDLECPFCKEEASTLDRLMNVDPGKARVIFKFFPLTTIHPWSMQAAEAGECVAQQGSAGFWNFERAVFAAQDKITPAIAKARLRDFASEAGVKLPQYDACLLRPSTHAAVEASIAEGKRLGVESTPTLFVNGRPIPGAIPEQQMQMLVDHEASYHVTHKVAADGPLGSEIKGQQCGTCTPLPPLPKSYKPAQSKPKSSTCCARP